MYLPIFKFRLDKSENLKRSSKMAVILKWLFYNLVLKFFLCISIIFWHKAHSNFFNFSKQILNTVFLRIVSAKTIFLLNLTLCSGTFGHSTYKCGNYSREETIKGRKLFAEIRCMDLTENLTESLPPKLENIE